MLADEAGRSGRRSIDGAKGGGQSSGDSGKVTNGGVTEGLFIGQSD
jgi:hypothetical protein